jgi:ADP-heptose:LPS heptosyltransferase
MSWAARIARRGAATTAERFGLTAPFALLVPGASAGKTEKFWPAAAYGELAAALIARGLTVAVVGSRAEAPLARVILATAPAAIDLTGQTDLFDLAGLGQEAAVCVGNDTGPTHLIGYAGAPGLMLMSRVTQPWHCAVRGRMGAVKVEDLAALPAAQVLAALEGQLGDRALGQAQKV